MPAPFAGARLASGVEGTIPAPVFPGRGTEKGAIKTSVLPQGFQILAGERISLQLEGGLFVATTVKEDGIGAGRCSWNLLKKFELLEAQRWASGCILGPAEGI